MFNDQILTVSKHSTLASRDPPVSEPTETRVPIRAQTRLCIQKHGLAYTGTWMYTLKRTDTHTYGK